MIVLRQGSDRLVHDDTFYSPNLIPAIDKRHEMDRRHHKEESSWHHGLRRTDREVQHDA